MTAATITDHEVFWLARYAYNTLAPLFDEVQKFEPSTKLAIQMDFAKPEEGSIKRNHINIYGHWERPGMFQYHAWLTTKAEVDAVADSVRAYIKEQEAA